MSKSNLKPLQPFTEREGKILKTALEIAIQAKDLFEGAEQDYCLDFTEEEVKSISIKVFLLSQREKKT